MKIILLRHGRPDVDLHSMRMKRWSSNELNRLVSAYNLAGLRKNENVSDDILEMVVTCNAVIHSDLPRSIDSAKALKLNNIYHFSDSTFREANLPFANWKYPKLPLIIWFLFFRTLWYFGYSNNAESISKVRERAAIGAIKLQECSEKYGTVILVGHGVINRFIAEVLLSTGWDGPKVPGDKFWEYGIYTYITT